MNKCGKHNLTLRLLMRITLLHLLLAGAFVMSASAKSVNGQGILDRKISLSENGQNLKRVLRNIEAVAGVKFTYDSRLVAAQGQVNLDARDEALKIVLDRLLNPLSIRYEVVNDQIILRRVAPVPTGHEMVSEATSVISGTVFSQEGIALPGVSVSIEGTKQGMVTDARGHFDIQAKEGDGLPATHAPARTCEGCARHRPGRLIETVATRDGRCRIRKPPT